MKSWIIVTFLMLCGSHLFAQEQELVSETAYMVVETMPIYAPDECVNHSDPSTCSQENLLAYLGTINYPAVAIERGWMGKVFVKFIINTEGEVEDVSIARDNTNEIGCDVLTNAALQHIQKMGRWYPGQQKGEAVNVQFVVPINFKMNIALDELQKLEKKARKMKNPCD